jgi:hypothetical protein
VNAAQQPAFVPRHAAQSLSGTGSVMLQGGAAPLPPAPVLPALAEDALATGPPAADALATGPPLPPVEDTAVALSPLPAPPTPRDDVSTITVGPHAGALAPSQTNDTTTTQARFMGTPGEARVRGYAIRSGARGERRDQPPQADAQLALKQFSYAAKLASPAHAELVEDSAPVAHW